MCQALIPTSWFVDCWQDYRDRALANNHEARVLAQELGDEDLQIAAASAGLRLLAPGETHDEAVRLRARLEARRDPLRLKEHLFWLMWHYWLRGELAQCVATCDDGIALAAQLGSPPVQYASIKGLALTDLGRFDEAWASFQAEVADDAHPFGRCMRELGVACWLESLGALDRAAAKAEEVLHDAERLSRVWMQRFMADLLVVIAVRRGQNADTRAAGPVRKGNELSFYPAALPAGEMALARGDGATALDIADHVAEVGARSGVRRVRVIALELGLRALAGLERWNELLARADAALGEAEQAGFKTRHWRMLAKRAQARDATGDVAGAREDRSAARALLDEMAGRIADQELRALFESDPAATEVRNG